MFEITPDPLEAIDLKSAMRNPSAGALATFEGWVRDHNEGKTVLALEYEVYESLALKEGRRILEDAARRFQILEARATHRCGRLEIGEMAVWVGVSSAHRSEAFAACQFIIDELKVRLPIWKKEFYTSGDSGWVDCEACAVHAGHPHGKARSAH